MAKDGRSPFCDAFFTRRYRIVTRVWRAFRFRDLLGFGLLGAAATLTLIGKNLRIALPVFLLYLSLAMLRAYLTVRDRQARYAIQAHVTGGLFAFINRELFHRSNHTRFTLFRQAPFRSKHVIPYYRFLRGGRGIIEEADSSRARYAYDKKTPEGVTGRSWVNPATKLVLNVFPDFGGSRSLMRAYYETMLNVRPETAGAISDFMVDAQAIVTYTFLDAREQFLGLLSLDLWNANVRLDVRDDHSIFLITPRSAVEPEITVDSDTLFLLVRAIGNVLESFRTFEKRGGLYGQE